MTSSTLVEKIAMQKLYQKHLLPNDEGNSFYFEGGWDDNRIAKAVNPNLTSSHARYVRTELFGVVKPMPKPKSVRLKLLERIEVLETQVQAIKRCLGMDITTPEKDTPPQ